MNAAKKAFEQISSKKVSTYKKTITIFVACILAVVSMAYIINQVGEKIIRDGLYQSQMANIGFCETMLNDEFMILYEQQSRILEDISVQEMLLADEEITYAQSARITKLADELKTLASYHSNIKECGLYIAAGNMIINNLTFLSLNDLERAERIRGFVKNGNGQIAFYGGDLVFYMGQPRNASGEKSAIIYTVIDGQKLKTTLGMINPQAVNILTSLAFSDKIHSGRLTDDIEAGLKKSAGEYRDGGVFERMLDGKKHWVASMPLRPYGLMLYSCVDEATMTGNLQILNILAAALLAICIGVILAFILLMQRIIYRPISRLIAAFDELDKGNLDVKIEFSRKDEFGYLYHVFNGMTQGLKASFNQSFEQAVHLEKAELSRLYLQVHPHFLYNCLFNISNLCTTGDYENVGKFTRLLGSYYRYITYGTEKIVTLADEYGYMNQYVQMQGLRFGSRISVEIEPLPQWAGEVRVPKFILQPVVENAYKHGCEVNLDSGLIRVSFSREGEYICVYVEDNGKNLTDEALCALHERLEGIFPEDGREGGLTNIHRRLVLYCGEKSGLFAARSALGGVRIVIRFLGCAPDAENPRL